ncbi:DUF3892 domain-containing protein [Staphylococcus caeli]|uniref:DUF3892 domain-containing protein n=1 Tax=Staphylococcus caeli TaxID=2201815 RepID=UPI003F560170
MPFQITHIKLGNIKEHGTKQISQVKLSNNIIESTNLVVLYIDAGMKYYYVGPDEIKYNVETAHFDNQNTYIRTANNINVLDNLLNLPKF